MPDNPKFPIPSVIDPEKTRCIQLEIPDNDDWMRVFVGLLAQPTYWFNWQPNAGKNGKDLAQIWTKIYDKIDWSNMSCCVDPLIRLNPDGTVSVSTDGGSTYHLDPSQDPRNQLPQFPPQVGANPADTKCKAANSVVRQMKDIQIGNSSAIGTYTTLLSMAAQAVALAVLVFVDPALIPFLIGLFFELAAALLTTTSTAYNALFSDDDWNWVLCEVYCKMNDDGTFKADEFINMQADFDTHFSGNAALTFSSILNSWQVAGVNRAAAIPTSDNLTCSSCPDCNCPDICMFDYNFYGVHDVVFDGCNTYTMKANGGSTHVAFSTLNQDNGCYWDIPLLFTIGSIWPVGSPSPVGGTNPKITKVWNFDIAGFAVDELVSFVFSSSPFLP